MEKFRLEIIVKVSHQKIFELILVDFFGRKKTPVYPIYVYCDILRKLLSKEEIVNDVLRTYEVFFQNFEIVEASEDQSIWRIPLATISMMQYPTELVVFIEGNNKQDRKKVEDIVREIIARAKLLKFEIEAPSLSGLLPKSSLPPWEQIPDHISDREILKLWHYDYTNREIGKKTNLSPSTITNLISKLRSVHGTDIVQTEEQRRRKRIKKTDDSV